MKAVIAYLFIMVFAFTACAVQQNDDSNPGINNLGNVQLQEETTSVGGWAGEYALSSTRKINTIGAPFTQDEINDQFDSLFLKELLQYEFSDCEIDMKGYYSIFLERDFCINYEYLQLPMFRDDSIVNCVLIMRSESEDTGPVGSAISTIGGANSFDELFRDYPDSEYIMLYGRSSQAAVTPDDLIHRLNGGDIFKTADGDSIFSSYKTDDNTFSKNRIRVSVSDLLD